MQFVSFEDYDKISDIRPKYENPFYKLMDRLKLSISQSNVSRNHNKTDESLNSNDSRNKISLKEQKEYDRRVLSQLNTIIAPKNPSAKLSIESSLNPGISRASVVIDKFSPSFGSSRVNHLSVISKSPQSFNSSIDLKKFRLEDSSTTDDLLISSPLRNSSYSNSFSDLQKHISTGSYNSNSRFINEDSHFNSISEVVPTNDFVVKKEFIPLFKKKIPLIPEARKKIKINVEASLNKKPNRVSIEKKPQKLVNYDLDYDTEESKDQEVFSKCDKCKEKFKTSELQHHCNSCGENFCSDCILLTKTNKIVDERFNALVCPSCSQSFTRSSSTQNLQQNLISNTNNDENRIITVKNLVFKNISQINGKNKKAIAKRDIWRNSIKFSENSLIHLKKMCVQLLKDENVVDFQKWIDILVGLVIQSVDYTHVAVEIGGSNDLSQYIRIKIIPNGRIEHSRYLNGAIISKVFANKNNSKVIKDVRLIIISFPLKYDTIEDQYVSLGKVNELEDKYVSKVVSRIASYKPNLLLLEKGISNSFLKELSKRNISVVTDIRRSVLRNIAYLAGADIISSVDKLYNNPALGKCGNMYTQVFQNEDMLCGVENIIFLDNCKPERGGTIILRGGSGIELAPVKRAAKMLLSLAHGLGSQQAIITNDFGVFSHELAKRKELLSFKTMDHLEANKVLQTYSQKISSTFPYSILKYPPELIRMVEAENKLKILNDRYTHLNLGFDEISESTHPSTPSIPLDLQFPLSQKFLKDNKNTEESRSYLSFLRESAPLERLVNLGNDFIKNNKVPPSLWENQNLVIAYVVKQNKEVHSGRCRTCIPPQVHTIEFHCLNDTTLGHFLQMICFNLNLDCPSDNPCGYPLYQHTLSYISGDCSVDVSMSEFPCPISGMSEIILMWAECRKCKSKTPYTSLSYDSWYLSFGKYLEIFYNGENITPRASVCQHRLYLDFTHWFTYRNMSVKINRQSLKVYDIIPPSLPLNFEIDTNIEIKNEEVSILSSRLHNYFDSLLSLIKSFPIEDIPPSSKQQYQASVDNLNQRVLSENTYFAKFLSQVSSSSHPADTLSLAQVYVRLQNKVIEWDFLISNLYASLLKQKNSSLASYLGLLKRNHSFATNKTENSALGTIISRSNTNPSPFAAQLNDNDKLSFFDVGSSNIRGDDFYSNDEIVFSSNLNIEPETKLEDTDIPLLGKSPFSDESQYEITQNIDLEVYKRRSHFRRMSIEIIKEERRRDALLKSGTNKKSKYLKPTILPGEHLYFIGNNKNRSESPSNLLIRESVESSSRFDFDSIPQTKIEKLPGIDIDKQSSSLNPITPNSEDLKYVQRFISEKSEFTKVNREKIHSPRMVRGKLEGDKRKLRLNNSDFFSSEPSLIKYTQSAINTRSMHSNFVENSSVKKNNSAFHFNTTGKRLSNYSLIKKPERLLSTRSFSKIDTINNSSPKNRKEMSKESLNNGLNLKNNSYNSYRSKNGNAILNKSKLGSGNIKGEGFNRANHTSNNNSNNGLVTKFPKSNSHIRSLLGINKGEVPKDGYGFPNIIDIFPQRRGILLSSSIQNINLHSQTLNMPNIKVFSTKSVINNRNTKFKKVESSESLREGINNKYNKKIFNKPLLKNPTKPLTGGLTVSSKLETNPRKKVGPVNKPNISHMSKNNNRIHSLSGMKTVKGLSAHPSNLSINSSQMGKKEDYVPQVKKLKQLNNIPLRSAKSKPVDKVRFSDHKNGNNLQYPPLQGSSSKIYSNHNSSLSRFPKQSSFLKLSNKNNSSTYSGKIMENKNNQNSIMKNPTPKKLTANISKGGEFVQEHNYFNPDKSKQSYNNSNSKSREEEYTSIIESIRNLFISNSSILKPTVFERSSNPYHKTPNSLEIESKPLKTPSSSIPNPFRNPNSTNLYLNESHLKKPENNFVSALQSKLKPLHSTWNSFRSSLFGFVKKSDKGDYINEEIASNNEPEGSNYNEFVSYTKILNDISLFKDKPLISNVPAPKSLKNIRNLGGLETGNILKGHKRHFSDYSQMSSSYPKSGFTIADPTNKNNFGDRNNFNSSENDVKTQLVKENPRFDKFKKGHRLSISLGNVDNYLSYSKSFNFKGTHPPDEANTKNSNLSHKSFVCGSSDSSSSFDLSKRSSIETSNQGLSDYEFNYNPYNDKNPSILRSFVKASGGDLKSDSPSISSTDSSSTSSISSNNWCDLQAIESDSQSFLEDYDSELYKNYNYQSSEKEVYYNNGSHLSHSKMGKYLGIPSISNKKKSKDSSGKLASLDLYDMDYPVIRPHKHGGSVSNTGESELEIPKKSYTNSEDGFSDSNNFENILYTKKGFDEPHLFSNGLFEDSQTADIFPNSQAQSPTISNRNENGDFSKTESAVAKKPHRYKRHSRHKSKDMRYNEDHESYSSYRMDDREEKSGKFWKNILGLLQLSENDSLFDFASKIKYPLLPTDHVIEGCGVIIRETEPSSIVAFILASSNYQAQLHKLYSKYGSPYINSCQDIFIPEKDFEFYSSDHNPSEKNNSASDFDKIKIATNKEVWKFDEDKIDFAFLNLPSHHTEFSFVSGQTRFGCKLYYIAQFEALRQVNLCGETFLESLSRCTELSMTGGKSGSSFLKTKDERYILKHVSKVEMNAFIDFAPAYFNQMFKSYKNKEINLLTRIFGLCKVSLSNNITKNTKRYNFIVMENLFYKKKISRIYDLKGSERNRMAYEKDDNEVLLDENLINYIHDSPIFVSYRSKKLILDAITRDTLFLSNMNVMDYSLLVGIDEENDELVIGIVDFIRTFTWDKKLENWIKDSMFLGTGGKEPTITSPSQYKTRFCDAMTRYFWLAPDIYDIKYE
ncbi:1-phosphatidylinositol 3-phosphate 5-kinase fab1 [Smittium mucronatum]|uniref:1-phosphatidylinositol-3-phosphate 5-kinase n=1 Tax=Smittium mucronatum TaxID=133383 RepID=A0A1R0H1W2_9FUNG|nr:1-phosphatidylinositol 3-phosphate 5-kinase fab1 [Smittium mucronatum]